MQSYQVVVDPNIQPPISQQQQQSLTLPVTQQEQSLVQHEQQYMQTTQQNFQPLIFGNSGNYMI